MTILIVSCTKKTADGYEPTIYLHKPGFAPLIRSEGAFPSRNIARSATFLTHRMLTHMIEEKINKRRMS